MKTKRKPTKIEICRKIRKKAVKSFGNPNLACYCGICSTAIAKMFKKYGYDARICFGYFKDDSDHCWVESNKKIYDITATQFYCSADCNYDELIVMDIKDGRDKLYPKPEKRIKPTYKEINKLFKDWPSEQKPYKKVIKKLEL